MIDWFPLNRLEAPRKTLRFAAQGWDKQAFCGEAEERTDTILRGIDQTITELKAVRDYLETNRNTELKNVS